MSATDRADIACPKRALRPFLTYRHVLLPSMSEATATDADEALLDELAGMLMSAARMAHARMAGAGDDKAFHAAGQTLHRMARSLRQTLALKQRSRRETAETAHETAMRGSNRRLEHVIRRREVVKAAVE